MEIIKELLKSVIILATLSCSSLSHANIKLIDTGTYVPDEPVISSRLIMNTGYRYAGEFNLKKNSHLMQMHTTLSGTGSLSFAIYDQDPNSNYPGDILFEMIVNINSPNTKIWAGVDDMSVVLGKGSYWFVIEPVTQSDQLYGETHFMLNPLESYIIDPNHNGEWSESRYEFPLVIEGHPTGIPFNPNCLNRNINSAICN